MDKKLSEDLCVFLEDSEREKRSIEETQKERTKELISVVDEIVPLQKRKSELEDSAIVSDICLRKLNERKVIIGHYLADCYNSEELISALRKRESNTCSICLKVYTGKRCATLCGHVFHLECIQTWISALRNRESSTCPICKKKVNLNELVTLFI